MFDALVPAARPDLLVAQEPRADLAARPRRGARRDPRRAARRRRRAVRRRRVPRRRPVALRARGAVEEPDAGPAGREGRQRRARRGARRRAAEGHLRLAAPDRRAARRPAGRGQDDRGGQARDLVQVPGALARCSSPRTSSAPRPSSSCASSAARRACRSSPGRPTPSTSRSAGVDEAARVGRDVCIIDTAGRLAIDEALMDEVRTISARTSPHYTFLVIDAMTGQDAVQTATALPRRARPRRGHRDEARRRRARRRRALAFAPSSASPIVFASVGERLADLDLFYPERMASRILGMGDVLSLIDQAERTMDADVVQSTAERHDGRPVHPRRLPRPAHPGAQDGLARRAHAAHAGDEPRHARGRRPARRPGGRPHRGDRAVDDDARSAPTRRSSTARGASASRAARAPRSRR